MCSRRKSRIENIEPLARREIDEIVAVHVQAVEEERGERQRIRRDRLRAEAAHRDLKRLRAAVLAKRDRLAVEHDRRDVERADRSDDLGHALGDVGEVAREDRDVVSHAMGLDPCAVELPLDVRGLQSLETGRDVAGRLGEHRADRAQRGQPEPREPVATLAHRDLGDRGEIAGEHRRAAHVRSRYAGRLRDRVRHHALERSLPKLAEEQADEETLFGLGRPREERRELLTARCLGALADD